MRVIISGGTGLIGRALAGDLAKDGHEVILLSRSPRQQAAFPAGVRQVTWDGRTAAGWGELADGADAIVNLAGENLAAGRWTAKRKKAILESRVNAGKAVVQAVHSAVNKPRMVIQSSAVGYYGPSDAVGLDEDASPGSDYLAGVCRDWEDATREVEALGVRRAVVRSGVVMCTDSVAFKRMVLQSKFFIGGPLGSGKQWMSWIHLEDEVGALRHLIDSSTAQGAFNLAAQVVTNRQFAQTIGKVLHRPSFIPVPAFAIRLLFGEMATVVLDGQNVSSKRLTDLGFKFRYPDPESALRNLLGRPA
jgi:hypothetical protein